jgi:hypothetical protein
MRNDTPTLFDGIPTTTQPAQKVKSTGKARVITNDTVERIRAYIDKREQCIELQKQGFTNEEIIEKLGL